MTDSNSKKGFIRIANFAMLFSVVAHSITCFFYLLAKDEKNLSLGDTYLANSDLNIDQAYVKTLYWTITTISTVGYGDIGPKTSAEIAYVMFVQFIGVITFAYLTGSITSILMNLNQREKILSENEISLDKWFLDLNSQGKYKVPDDLQKSIKQYFMYFWKNDYGKLLNETGFLMRMPLNLKNEFNEYLFSDEIEDFKVFFADCDQQLRYNLMANLFPRLFQDKAFIIKIYSEVEEVFIIRRGSALLTSAAGVSFLSLGENSFFGEEYTLLNKRPKINFISGKTGMECFCIKKSKYLELLNASPKSFKPILRRAFKRGKYFKAVMQKSLNTEQIGGDELIEGKQATISSGALNYLDNFTWELTEEENDELNNIVLKNNEITVKESITENVKKSVGNVRNIQENLEKVSEKMEEIKKLYATDVESLIQVINLLRSGHELEATDLLSRIKKTH